MRSIKRRCPGASQTPAFDFGVPGTVTTTIRVFDVGGDERDFKEILVTLGEPLPEEVFANGFED